MDEKYLITYTYMNGYEHTFIKKKDDSESGEN